MIFFSWLKDQALARMQRGCEHPGNMVAADILEGCVPWYRVKYCNRCGAVQIEQTGAHENRRIETAWRKPDPNLWRG